MKVISQRNLKYIEEYVLAPTLFSIFFFFFFNPFLDTLSSAESIHLHIRSYGNFFNFICLWGNCNVKHQLRELLVTMMQYSSHKKYELQKISSRFVLFCDESVNMAQNMLTTPEASLNKITHKFCTDSVSCKNTMRLYQMIYLNMSRLILAWEMQLSHWTVKCIYLAWILIKLLQSQWELGNS